jgi:hypothetical protein
MRRGEVQNTLKEEASIGTQNLFGREEPTIAVAAGQKKSKSENGKRNLPICGRI